MSSSNEDTVEFETQRTFAERFFAPREAKFSLDAAAASHVGKVRRNNEDHYAVIRQTRSREVLFTNLPQDGLVLPSDEAYGLVVADGVGGAASGDVASQLALSTMFELAGRATSWVMKFTDLDAQEIHQRVEAYVTEIQKTLRFVSEQNPKLAGMGTTWTSAHVFGKHAVIVHIGDSRAYLHRNGELQLITRDQTLGQEMVDAGLNEEDVRRFRHILTNSLGGSHDEVEAIVYHVELTPGDRLLLCTDGLSDMATREEIVDVLQREQTPRSACDALIQIALQAGGKDNITVAICNIETAR